MKHFRFHVEMASMVRVGHKGFQTPETTSARRFGTTLETHLCCEGAAATWIIWENAVAEALSHPVLYWSPRTWARFQDAFE